MSKVDVPLKLMIQNEGAFMVCSIAGMDEEILVNEIARIHVNAVKRPDRLKQWLTLCGDILADEIEEGFGQRPTMEIKAVDGNPTTVN